MDYSLIPSPCYVLDEKAFRNNLALIKSVKERAGVEIILAFKAFAMWSVFPIVREYIPCSTASSLAEARLAYEEMGSPAHTYAPAYSGAEFSEIMSYSSHITFNSLSQFYQFYPQTVGKNISCGLRINPEFSDVETDLYNPCAPGSRLGVIVDGLGEQLPEGIEGLHFHTLCESTSYDLEKTLNVVENKFGKYFQQIKWLNMGGGHLMTREGYDVEHLINTLQNFKARYPHLQLILEPGSAFAWRTGVLVSTVLDVVENKGIKTAMLDVSDGLASDLLHLCSQSGVGALVFEENLPIDEQTYLAATELNLSAITAAMNGGEDYELLFSVRQADYDKVKNNPKISVIGYLTAEPNQVLLSTKGGSQVPITAQGWNHF